MLRQSNKPLERDVHRPVRRLDATDVKTTVCTASVRTETECSVLLPTSDTLIGKRALRSAHLLLEG